MKNYIIILLMILICSCSTINYQNAYYGDKNLSPFYTYTFTDKSQIPNKLIISEQYLQTKNRIFMINQNWASTYSKLVEYDLGNSSIVKEICSYDGKNQTISEAVIDNSYLVYVVTRVTANQKYKDIFLYNIESGVNTLIKSDILTSKNGEYSPNLYIILNNNSIYWINPDIDKGTSMIVEYNITEHSTRVIHEQAFLEKGFMNHIPITFLSLSDKYLIFNIRSDNTSNQITFLDLKTKAIIQKTDLPVEFVFTYYGVTNEKGDCLYLYGRTKENELIYCYNAETKAVKKLVGFMERSFIKNNKLIFSDNQLLYSVELYFTGNVQDNYFSEVYDLNHYTMQRYQSVFHLVKLPKYFAFLQLDENEGPNKIKLKIYQTKVN